MDSSPFNRSSKTVRSPPPTPPVGPAPAPPMRPNAPSQGEDVHDVMPTPEIQSWMTIIEQSLNEICSIVSEGKMNTEQKLRINYLCRKVDNAKSHMAVRYQSLKIRTVQAYSSIQSLEEKVDLSHHLENLKRTVEESSKLPVTKSFADMVKKGTNNYIQPTKLNTIAIYPEDKLKSSDDTKSLVQKIISPEQMKLHVRGLHKVKNGGVIISTDTKNDIQKLKQSVQLTNSGLKIDEPHKRKPRVVVIGVPTSMQEKEVFTCLYHQNLADVLPSCNLETFFDSVRLSHKSGKKDGETCNYIIEVSAEIRKALITKDRVFVNWSSCPVKDFTLVTRCFKCQKYGHAAKTCREATYICGHCGDRGHSIKDCAKKAEEPQCATCLHYKKPSKHITGCIDCPAKIMAEKRYINTIDYGDT